MKLPKSNARRSKMTIVIAIAKPENIAPATKNGGKIVECQPGVLPVAKSKPTTLWTETTSGTASPASSSCALWRRCQWRASPRQPSASKP